jgi:hypothetical protein
MGVKTYGQTLNQGVASHGSSREPTSVEAKASSSLVHWINATVSHIFRPQNEKGYSPERTKFEPGIECLLSPRACAMLFNTVGVALDEVRDKPCRP